MTARRAVWLIARRELHARLRTRSFLIGTAVSVAVLIGFVLLQSTVFGAANVTRVGLSGQATVLSGSLGEEARTRGVDVRASTVRDPVAGEAMVADGDLDALVTGPPAALRVVVGDTLDENLRRALNALVQQEVLRAQLAAVEELDPDQVLATVADAGVDVRSLHAPDAQRDQRLAVALVIVALLYLSLLLYGTMVAQGVVEEKSSRVVEILLATVRPWQLLLGKVIGLGLVGLAQLAVIGAVGVVLATATEVLTIPGAALGTLVWGLFWYLLGYLFYASVFAAAGSLVSRQEETQAVLLPVTSVLVLAFVLGLGLLTRSPNGTATAVLSVLPPFAPILMPGRIALAEAPAGQIALAAALTLAAVALLARLGGRIYAGAILRTGPRIPLREALRG
ncbi:ABC transporter permease [Actinokineospora iranica]|uniref:ABC-2 type transport system permease protein n=1 Tax=Actinokineospora iranica TaxID=1271860 RepID=A0A1G6TKA8_9PSEU|nr:ABC transporter permease [Actinokineospora iranica]SDD28847.1 ABC-2 type transport system permease protein [Actinokineospora iranica]